MRRIFSEGRVLHFKTVVLPKPCLLGLRGTKSITLQGHIWLSSSLHIGKQHMLSTTAFYGLLIISIFCPCILFFKSSKSSITFFGVLYKTMVYLM